VPGHRAQGEWGAPPFLTSRRGESARAEKWAMTSLRKEVRRDPEALLKKNMPLFQSRSGDPWVKDVLWVWRVTRGCHVEVLPG
jgi:hypothetical protein